MFAEHLLWLGPMWQRPKVTILTEPWQLKLSLALGCWAYTKDRNAEADSEQRWSYPDSKCTDKFKNLISHPAQAEPGEARDHRGHPQASSQYRRILPPPDWTKELTKQRQWWQHLLAGLAMKHFYVTLQ